jgi:hypothetical protein
MECSAGLMDHDTRDNGSRERQKASVNFTTQTVTFTRENSTKTGSTEMAAASMLPEPSTQAGGPTESNSVMGYINGRTVTLLRESFAREKNTVWVNSPGRITVPTTAAGRMIEWKARGCFCGQTDEASKDSGKII